MNRFQDKVVLVTGAASGMGRASCIRLATEGAAVFGIDIDEKGLLESAEIVNSAGGKMEHAVCDVSGRENCFNAISQAVECFGKLDVLVNVAGIVRFGHSHEVSEQEWNLVLAINLSGPMFLSQAAIPHLLKSEGNIVNIASNAGLMGQAYTAAYCASKGGLIQLTKAMAMEYIKTPVRINAVCPGGTDTEMVEGAKLPDQVDFDLLSRYIGLRGNGKPEDIASMIAYIASDEAKMVHGSIISVDNGMMAG